MNRRRGAEPIPDMSTDNTDDTLDVAGVPVGVDSANEIINQLVEGMRVVDVHGEELGKVEYVKMGNPDAATVSPAALDRPGLIEAFLGQGEPDVPEPMRSRLLRGGYFKIDGKGWIDTDRYVTAGSIASISGDTVRLAVDKDRILAEM